MKTTQNIFSDIHRPKLFFDDPYGLYGGCYIGHHYSSDVDDNKEKELPINDELEYDESGDLEYDEDGEITDTEYDEDFDDEDFDEDEYKDDTQEASGAYHHHIKS